MARRISLLWLAFCICAMSTTAWANVPLLLNQQGRVLDSTGKPLSGVQTLTFTLHDSASGGIQL